MVNSQPRAGAFVALAAAAGAFGAAAMMSTTAAPAAHADDFTDVIASVQADYADGASALTNAFADFDTANGFASGLALLIDGTDDESVSPAENLLVGSIDVLTGKDVIEPITWTYILPASFSDSVTEAETIFSTGEGYLSTAISDLASGDLADASYFDALAVDYTAIGPLQELLLGAAVALDPGAIVY